MGLSCWLALILGLGAPISGDASAVAGGLGPACWGVHHAWSSPLPPLPEPEPPGGDSVLNEEEEDGEEGDLHFAERQRSGRAEGPVSRLKDIDTRTFSADFAESPAPRGPPLATAAIITSPQPA